MAPLTDLPDCSPDAHTQRESTTLPPRANIEAAAMMLRAAGDPARLRILLLLANGERCVTELAEAEDEKIATVSARLKQLHAARLVSKRREAKHIYYTLADDHVVHLLRDILDHAAEDPSLV
ncbi:MAG: helix-turn-helix transcriptional regulator [Roseibium sp.]|uniref:ArsR/SmtB family transcription factor n=1 Tax=Roseibium sp. TaxID=1936156 RepID=UPI001B0F651C|nr:helix-turn-helix domain-containing protein [Roseibium sp.]MBO6894832.1 helix-turn-helix transcriptional regulator [Roseibium sp.]MBO6930405.1 helix-turn-helix transcriptional regulator [Roseibium sp.]